MKISKLFHWLYAILMLTPVSAVGITCLTHVFNEEVAEETQTATVTYQYENNINPQTNLQNNTLYEMKVNDNNFHYYGHILYLAVTENNAIIYSYNNYDRDNENYFDYGAVCYITNDSIELLYDVNYMDLTNDNNVYVVFYDVQSIESTYGISNILYQTSFNGPVENVSIETVPQDQTTNIFYDSCEQVKDSFVLNWCNNNNPVREIFNYGSALFNVDSDNLVNYFLTYWLSISIIWLVFDVFMYVPLLVHRWIDKAKIE